MDGWGMAGAGIRRKEGMPGAAIGHVLFFREIVTRPQSARRDEPMATRSQGEFSCAQCTVASSSLERLSPPPPGLDPR